mgnify:CR=1 FL=1
MDELTAGSAEVESEKTPPVTSVYQIWDVLMGGSRAEYVGPWFDITNMRLASPEGDDVITQSHKDYYPTLREETTATLTTTSQDDTIYNEWI